MMSAPTPSPKREKLRTTSPACALPSGPKRLWLSRAASMVPAMIDAMMRVVAAAMRAIANRSRMSIRARLGTFGTAAGSPPGPIISSVMPCLSVEQQWVAGSAELVEDFVAVVGTTRLDLQGDLDLVEVKVRPGAQMLDVEHVCLRACENVQQPGELARPVGDAQPERQVPTGCGQAVSQHTQQQQRVDVAARDHGSDVRFVRRRVGEHSCHCGDTGR